MKYSEDQYTRLLMNIAVKVSAFRQSKGLRQIDLEKYGISERLVQRIEGGNYTPSLKTLLKIASALDVNLFEIMIPPKK